MPLRSVAPATVYSCRFGGVLAERGPGGLLPMGLIALAAVFYSTPPGAGPTQKVARNEAPASSGRSSPAADASPPEDPLRLVSEFFNARSGRGEKPESPPNSAGTYTVRFLVATVPDPLDSHLAQNFDRAVDAIQHGVQDSGYVLDRIYLPWKKDVEAGWNLAINPRGSTDGWLTVSAKTASDLHRRTPGVLLFRGGKDPNYERGGKDPNYELLVVFLVGEIPTSGIQREAFTRSLDAIRKCKTAVPVGSRCESERIQLLAPYFSGSAQSLRNSLLAQGNGGKDVEILSGSATVAGNRELLTFDPNEFQATVIPDDALQNEFFGFLPALGIRPSDVAFFVEGSTGYGSAAEKRLGSKPAEKSDKRGGPGPRESEFVRFVIQFPLHVSQLRGAYEKDEALRSGGVFNRGPRHTLELPLETSETNPSDILPPQDPKMTANVAELSLAASIESIRRAHVRLVGIIATDPRDVLFLARKIREAGANVTLFTFGADILFAHPDYQRFLRGMLIATPYPLFPLNQKWTQAGRRRIAFSGSSEEGIYNAAVLLLAEPPRTAPASPPIEYSAPTEFGPLWPLRRVPPVWVTAVGRGGFWPIAFFPSYQDGGYVRPGPETSATDAPSKADLRKRRYWPEGAVLPFLLFDLFLAFLVLFHFQARVWRCGRLYPRAEELLSIWSWPVSRKANRVYVVSFFAIALLVQANLLIWFLQARAFFGPGLPYGLTFAGLLLLLLVWILVRELLGFARDRFLRRQSRKSLLHWLHLMAMAGSSGWVRMQARNTRKLTPRRTLLLARLGRWACFAAPLAVIVVILPRLALYLWSFWTTPPERTLSFAARALDMTSTLSPLVPFLLTMFVLLLWAVCNLQRAFLLETQLTLKQDGARPLPSRNQAYVSTVSGNEVTRFKEYEHAPGFLPPAREEPRSKRHAGASWERPYFKLRSFRGLERLQSDVVDCLSDPPTRIALALVPLLVLIPFYKTLGQEFTTIDGWVWSLLFKALLLCSYFVIVYSFGVFALVWIRLRRFLRRLASNPIVDAFLRLPESCAATPWKLWRTVPNLTTLAASVAQLRTVVNLGEEHLNADYRDHLTRLAASAEVLLGQIFTKGPKSVARSLRTQLELRKTLAEAKGILLTRLEGIWAQWPERSDRRLPKLGTEERTLGIPEWKRREVPAGLALWARAAEEFVALRISAFIRGIFQHMKNLLGFVFLGVLLSVVAISSYPFEPKHSVMTIVWIVVLGSAAYTAWIFINMERDPILSYIGKTEPGKVHISLDLLSSVGIYVLIPLLTLVATQFPGVGDVIFSIFSPAMRSLSH